MPLFEEKTNQNNQTSSSANQDNSAQSNQTQNQKPSGLLTIIGQLLPLAPFAFEQFTGQKVPQMTGTMAEIQQSINQLTTNLSVIVNNQTKI